MPSTPSRADRHAALSVQVPGLGSVRLTHALVENPETALYQTDHAGVVVKVFDLSCGRPDEIGYGPYLNFQAELANFEEIQALDDLREFVPAYFGGHIDYDAKFACIAMEYLRGHNLRFWAEETAARGYDATALDALRRAAREVFGILARFHQRGLIMIDFKPDNVIRLDNGTVRLVDLGAFFMPRHRGNVGSFVYTATPDHAEVLIDASNLQAGVPLSTASDVFSAGVALFELATGTSRLRLDPQTAEDMLAAPSMYRFRDSQIADVWRAFPHLKQALPLVQTQLRERQLLFSEVWHLLKAYVAAHVVDWEALPSLEQDQILLSTGTNFIVEQLPPALNWLGAAIAQATVLRSLRVRNLEALVELLASPAPEPVLADLATHNTLLRCLRNLELDTHFVTQLDTWETRADPASGRWAVAASAGVRALGDNAGFVYLHRSHADAEGNSYWEAVEEDAADETAVGKACLAHLANDPQAWIR